LPYPTVDKDDSELVTNFWASPTNPLSSGNLSLGGQSVAIFGR
jgi:hypothetical protein